MSVLCRSSCGTLRIDSGKNKVGMPRGGSKNLGEFYIKMIQL